MRNPMLLALVLLLGASLGLCETLPVGTTRQLFLDSRLIERQSGNIGLKLHSPTPREVVLTATEP